MADETQIQFDVDGPPAAAMAAWKADPPRALRERKFVLVDESFDTLMYTDKYMDWPQKITVVASLGMALLWKGFMDSSFNLNVKFADADGYRTRITIFGHAHPRTREALSALAAEHGGPVGLAVGV